MKIRNLAIPAGVALLAVASLAQITGIEGVIKGEDGKPLQGAIVKIHRTDIKGEYATKPTDKKGHYIYNGLPYGKYDLTVFVGEKQVDQLKGVQTRPGDLQQLNFDLKADTTPTASDANKQALAQKAMETGQISDDLARQLTPQQKADLQKQIDAGVSQRKKNNALNESYNNGITALEAKQYDAAIENLTKAGELDPNQIAVWSHLAQAYTEQAGTKTGAEHDAAVAKAIETYNRALTLKPDDPSLHNNFGLLLAKSGKFPEAAAELEKAAQLEPANACKYFYNLGALYTNAGQVDAAIDTFKKGIAADPNCADAYYQTGVNLMAKVTTTPDGKMVPVPGTVEAFQKYLALKPDGPYAQSAKDMLTTLGSTVDSAYKNPNAPPPKKKKGGGGL
jgi:tetratricopeptide (TPR) repeat protein